MNNMMTNEDVFYEVWAVIPETLWTDSEPPKMEYILYATVSTMREAVDIGRKVYETTGGLPAKIHKVEVSNVADYIVTK